MPSASQPVTAKDVAAALPPSVRQTASWREGSRGELGGRFAAVRGRCRPSHRDDRRAEPHVEEWLLIEWPEGKKELGKYKLSTLPAAICRRPPPWSGLSGCAGGSGATIKS